MAELYILGGPNGAGKTTVALKLLPGLGCREFINADLVASGLAPFQPESVALQAGVLMMRRLRELSASGVDFGTETTLAARAFVPFIRKCQDAGYRFNLFYIWLPSADMAVERVAARVRSGGHHIPEDTIRRRYEAGRANFNTLYRPLADAWRVLDNEGDDFRLVAEGGSNRETTINDASTWERIIR